MSSESFGNIKYSDVINSIVNFFSTKKICNDATNYNSLPTCYKQNYKKEIKKDDGYNAGGAWYFGLYWSKLCIIISDNYIEINTKNIETDIKARLKDVYGINFNFEQNIPENDFARFINYIVYYVSTRFYYVTSQFDYDSDNKIYNKRLVFKDDNTPLNDATYGKNYPELNDIIIHQETRDNVYDVLKNVLNNSIRYRAIKYITSIETDTACGPNS